ncbi:hypothetical protein RJ639_015233 [Escallonia herrerae]|uniref:Integrase catalytic domain-containing protein n=1 Tax=Escallonia herrerae TaxID=1293975 RepID=A0AA89AME9_9ASTE|nr:hypothetical protein RJ639_015233 [Escallonia herrerae]
MKYTTFLRGLRPASKFAFSVNKSPPGNMKALLEKANKYIQAEEYLETHRDRRGERKPEQKKRSREVTPPEGKSAKRSKRDERRPKDTFNLTPLNAKPSQILHEIKDNKALQWPDSMKSRPNKRNKDLWCHFHNNHGHTTDNCGSLKRAIEALIKRDQLRKFVALGEGRQQTPPAMEEREEREENAGTINTISGGIAAGGSSGKAHKAYAREDIKTPHNDPLVITIKAGNFDVKRVLIDNGSFAEILFHYAFKKMNIPTDRLRKMDTPLYGFSNHPVAAEGIIALPVAIGTPSAQANFMLDFVVVKVPSAYNAILGRPALNQLQAVVSTYHLKMKFPMGWDWRAADMPGIDPEIITHRLNVDPSKKPVKQKKRTFAPERQEKIDEEDVETRYSKIDKIVLALIISARRLRPYFQSHTIIVLTDQPLRKILLSPEASGRLVNQSVELGEFDIKYKPRTTIKAQALADFIVECTLPEEPPQLVISEAPDPWNLYVDGSSALASNNEAKYEALLAGIRLAHALKLASGEETDVRRPIYLEFLKDRSISSQTEVETIEQEPCWMDMIVIYLSTGELPSERHEARNLRVKAARYALVEDLLGPFPVASGKRRFVIVAIDYFTKWTEAESLATITSAKCEDFFWKNVVCRFGVPRALVVDNGKQFDNNNFWIFCTNLSIDLRFTSVAHPQSNGQTKNMNRSILQGLKKKLNEAKGAWVDELPKVLWAYRTTPHSVTGETPFLLCYGTEAMLPVEIGVLTIRALHFHEVKNGVGLRANLDLLDETRTQAHERSVVIKQRVTSYYNQRVRSKQFQEGDLVLRKLEVSDPKAGTRKLSPNWEGPYRVIKVLKPGAYALGTLSWEPIARTWNAENLRKYYQ